MKLLFFHLSPKILKCICFATFAMNFPDISVSETIFPTKRRHQTMFVEKTGGEFATLKLPGAHTQNTEACPKVTSPSKAIF